MSLQTQKILNSVEEILKTLYNRNTQLGMHAIEIDIECFRKTPEYKCFEKLLYSLFPYNLNVYIPEILVPVNLKYTQSNTEMLAKNLLENEHILFGF